MQLPELFVPYYFTFNFNFFERIAQEFDIILPEIPNKKDYKKRFFYYGEICKALYDFRISHDMSPYELCAFLYEYAPNHVGGFDIYIEKKLPEPKSAYFIGGTKNDIFLSDDEDTITPWQCNPDTMVGDMIVMYIKSPVSAITSVWQSVSAGFNDPFFYYYRCVYIANPRKIMNITQKTLERDAVFKELPIVKKNLQGINGVELYPSVYNHLLDIAQSDLPKIAGPDYTDNSNLKSEKDVENKIIKPFLNKLGYSDDEYTQQLRIKIGNHKEKFIPDFVVKPLRSVGHQSAYFVLEAKYSISNNKELLEAKIQVRNYSKLLNAKYAVIASKDKIWIMSDYDDYENDILSLDWETIKNEDSFFKVFNILGKNKNNPK